MKKAFVVALWVLAIFLFSTPAHGGENTDVYVNGNLLMPDVAPVLTEGRTMVPLRSIFEALSISVVWHEDIQAVTAEKEGIKLELLLGSNTAVVNGQMKELDVPAKLIRGRTMVPLRFISESYGWTVYWDEITNSVFVASKGNEGLIWRTLDAAYGKRGKESLDYGDYLRGEKIYQYLISKGDDSPANSFALAICYNGQERYQEALNILIPLNRAFPNQVLIYNQLAIAYNGLGDPNNAKRILKEAITLNEEYRDSYCNLGLIALEEGNREEARRMFFEALKFGENGKAYFYISKTFEKDFGDEALKYLEKAVEADPQQVNALNALGYYYLEKGDYKKALDYLNRAIAANPFYAPGYNNLAKVYLNIGQREIAISLINKAYRLAPHIKEIKDNYERYNQ